MALVVPAYCVLHLITSLTALPAASQTSGIRKASILVHPSELRVLPWSVLLGAGITSLLVFLAEPGSNLQQVALILRQIHPVLTAIAHLLLSIVTTPDQQFGSPDQRNIIVLNGLQKIYNFATYIAITTHTGVCTILLLSATIPSLFAPIYPSLFTPRSAFSPTAFWSPDHTRVHSFGEGAHAFFLWDELVSVTAILIWALAVNRQALAGQQGAPGFLRAVGRAGVMTVVGGPVAGAISLVRMRDVFVLSGLEGEGKGAVR